VKNNELKLPRGLAGVPVGGVETEIDARWPMAYAAGLGDTDPAYLDTLRPGGIVAHPLFPVCYEWPLAVESRARQLGEEIALRGVHATHDLVLHRRVRPGDRLRTTAAVVAVAPRRAGAYVLTRFATVDADGAPVSVTDYGSVYLGVACDPEGDLPAATNASGDELGGADPWTAEVPIPATLAHVYTECARIWNPIHTDPAVARRAGLSAILLHGTATLALSISAALARESRGAETPVARVACRFTGMVSLPSRLTVTGRSARDGDGTAIVTFRATTPDGRAALSDGWLAVGPSDPIPRSPR
jgi:acyl dehydratase